MSKNEIILYLVEGECEEKFINIYKTGEHAFLKPGQVEILNAVNKTITQARARAIKQNTVVVLVYDIDKGNQDILKRNIQTLKQYSLSKIIHVQSVLNFEDEIIRSTNLRSIDEMFMTKGIQNFKVAFLNHKDIAAKMSRIAFDPCQFWATLYQKGPFARFANKSSLNYIRYKKLP